MIIIPYYFHFKIQFTNLLKSQTVLFFFLFSLSEAHTDNRRTDMKEENVLFNDTLNTFYFWLYGVKQVVKLHSDSERENLPLPHGLLLPISSKGSFICTGQHIPQPILTGALAVRRNSSMGPPQRIDLMTHHTMMFTWDVEDILKQVW